MTYTPPKFCMRCDDPVSLCCCPANPPDIMEKAREVTAEYFRDAHSKASNNGEIPEFLTNLIAAALAEARAVPDGCVIPDGLRELKRFLISIAEHRGVILDPAELKGFREVALNHVKIIDKLFEHAAHNPPIAGGEG